MIDQLLSRRAAAIAALLAALALVFISCSEDATEQNALTAPAPLPSAVIRDTVIYAVQDSMFLKRLPMGGVTDLVGATGNGYTATAVIQFTPGLFPARDTAAVFGADLRLYITYTKGRPAGGAGTIAFNVYRVNRSWAPSTLDWDTLQAGFYDPSTLRGSFSASITADTGWISVPLDTTMVRQWLQTSTSTDVTKFGVALVPTAASNIVIGYQSFEGDSLSRKPSVVIRAGSVNGAFTDTATYSDGIDTFSGDGPGDLMLPGIFSIQAGVVYRGWLKFDVSFLTQSTLINNAELRVNMAALPQGQHLFDSTLVAHLATGTDLSTFESNSYSMRPLDSSPLTLSGEVRHIVQSWLRGANYGMVLRPESAVEFATFDRYDLAGVHRPAPGDTLRPRLHITYSMLNLGRNP